MNTPRSRPLVRFSNVRDPVIGRTPQPDGHYTGQLTNPDFLSLIAEIVTYLPQIEERMVRFMAVLIGDNSTPSRQIFHSLRSEEARITIMRALLEQAPRNKDKGQEYDDIIDLFASVKNKRNTYAHGLWHTHESGRVFLQEATLDDLGFLDKREVQKGELEATLRDMGRLWDMLTPIINPRRRSSPEKPAQPRDGSAS